MPGLELLSREPGQATPEDYQRGMDLMREFQDWAEVNEKDFRWPPKQAVELEA